MTEPTQAKATTAARSARWRRLRVGAGWTVAALAASWFAFAFWVERAGVYLPPELPAETLLTAPPVVSDTDGVTRCGKAWLHEDEGINELYIVGSPAARGHAAASLCARGMDLQEDQLTLELDRMLPAGSRRYFVRKGVLYAFRDLPSYVTQDDQVEVAAMARVMSARPRRDMDQEFPIYHRVLFYQSLYDIGQAMAEAGLVDTSLGCTSFAASGPATQGGGLVLGRNCDFEAGLVFDERKVVQFVRPDNGTPYASVSWSGMLGVVSGVNRDGLVVMLHAARTEESKWPRVGRPVPMILRDALMHDRTIDDVVQRFRSSPAHAAAIVLVAEIGTGKSAVIETDRTRTVVAPQGGTVTVATNHMLSEEWKGDQVVAATAAQGSSALRHERMSELLAAAHGKLDAPHAALILRDRLGIGGQEIGVGNRTSIAALIAAHAVVIDGAAWRLYVSRAPHGLGPYVAYDLRAFFDHDDVRSPSELRAVGGPSIDRDESMERASDVDRARMLLRRSAAARGAGDWATALTLSAEAVKLMDRAPEALLEEAEALAQSGARAEARTLASEALKRQPTPGIETARLRVLAAQ